MRKRTTAGLIGGALALIGAIASAEERGVQIRNIEAQDDAYVTIVDRNDHDRLIVDHYRINHGETYSVTPVFQSDHTYDLRWHAERTSDGKSKDGECVAQNTPCDVELYNAR